MNQNSEEIAASPAYKPEDLLNRPGTPESEGPFEAKNEIPESQPIRETKPSAPKEGGVLPQPPKKTRLTGTVPPPPRDAVTIKVEKILSEGLADAFEKLSPIAQQEFKLKGEQTASKIRELLHATRIKVKKILRLIIEWLMLLPNVNRFFLEQEAKIKTDKIVEIKKREAENMI